MLSWTRFKRIARDRPNLFLITGICYNRVDLCIKSSIMTVYFNQDSLYFKNSKIFSTLLSEIQPEHWLNKNTVGILKNALKKLSKMSQVIFIYAEVVIFWGHVDRLKDCQLYNNECANQEIKHLRCFWMFLFIFLNKGLEII